MRPISSTTRRALPQSAWATLVALAICVGAASGCGGAQTAGGTAPSDCGTLDPSSVDTLATRAACHRNGGSSENAAHCRSAVELAPEVPAAVLGVLADCVLQLRERGDGEWLASLLAAVSDEPTKLISVTNALGRTFDSGAHGVTFASSLSAPTQHAMGTVLDSLDPAAREALVSLALAHRIEPLLEYCTREVRARGADDPAVRSFAAQAATSRGPLGDVARWALIQTGTWTAHDAIRCYRKELAGCADWAGESPLLLLADTETEVGSAATPNQALRLIRSGELDADSVRGLATVIGGSEYDNRPAMLNALMNDMTDVNVSLETRRAIAEAATAPMCAAEQVREYLLRVQTSDPARLDDLTSPWPTLIARCVERHWGFDELMSAAVAGSWLGVPTAVYDDVWERLEREADGMSCDELRATAVLNYDASPWLLMRGLAHPLAARLGGDRCAATLEAPTRQVAGSSVEHPEARLSAIAWMLTRGDRNGCSSVDAIMRWRHTEYDIGPGPWAERQAAEVRAQCARR